MSTSVREAQRKQAAAERAHAALSRYFSPNLAERLASEDHIAILAVVQAEDVGALTTWLASDLAETISRSCLASS